MPGRIHVAVIGPGDAQPHHQELAERVGALLARAGAVVVTGGLGGVMRAACRGALEAGGTTVGLLPGPDRAQANDFLTVSIPTGLGEARNALVVSAGDGVIAIGRGWGTLSEIALAMRSGRPVASIDGWQLPGETPIPEFPDPDSAVRWVLDRLGH